MELIFAEALANTIPSSNENEDLLIIQALANDTDEYIRNLAAENLVHLTGAEAVPLLIRLAGDPDALVRANAFDSLGSFNDPAARGVLEKASRQEPDELARFYAIVSFADLMQASPSAAAFFQEALREESSPMCRLACAYCLYLLGDKSQLDRLLDGLKAEDYHIPCIAASFLQNILNDDNREMILSALYRALDAETSAAAIDRISQVLCEEDRLSFLQMALQNTGADSLWSKEC